MSKTEQTALPPNIPSMMPIIPPSIVIIDASARNCRRMEPVLAPRDLLGHRHKHNIHNADTADQQRNRRNEGNEHRQDAQNAVHLA